MVNQIVPPPMIDRSFLQLYVIQSIGGFEEDGSSRGGPVHFLRIAKAWTSLGHRVEFVTNNSDRGLNQYYELESVERLPSLGILTEGKSPNFVIEAIVNPLLQFRSLKRFVQRTRRQDLVGVAIAVSPYPSDVLNCFLLGKSEGLQRVVYLHHLSQPPWWHPTRRGSLARSTFNWMVSLLALTLSKLAGMLPCVDQPRTLNTTGWRFATGVMQNRNFVESGTGPSLIVQRVASRDQPMACFIGTIAPNKGVIDLLEAWGSVSQLLPAARLKIAGKSHSPGFSRKVERKLTSLGVSPSVEVLGYIDSLTKKQILDSSKVFVFPSYEEGWSLSVMEAVLHGALPVTYDLPAYDYLGDAKVTVPIGDISRLAESIRMYLSHEEERRVRVTKIRNHIASITQDAVAREQAETIYEYCTKGVLEQSTSAETS